MLGHLKKYNDIPAVFTADMNILEGEENYLQFVNSGFMYDTKYKAENTVNYLTYHDTHPSEQEKSIIDYIPMFLKNPLEKITLWKAEQKLQKKC